MSVAVVAVSLAVAGAGLSGCGGSSTDDVAQQAQARVDQAKAYAAAVGAITQRAAEGLTAISGRADYRDAEDAARVTGEYAVVIRTAAGELGRTTPPAAARREHDGLTALYRETASHMDALAAGFGDADGPAALTEQAQELSAEVQRYSTREARLRAAIDARLAASLGRATSPAAPATEAPAPEAPAPEAPTAPEPTLPNEPAPDG